MNGEVYLAKKKEGFFYFSSLNSNRKELKYDECRFENLGIIPFEEFGTMVPSVEVVRRAKNLGGRVIAQDMDGEDYSFTCLRIRGNEIREDLEKKAMPYRPGEMLLAD